MSERASQHVRVQRNSTSGSSAHSLRGDGSISSRFARNEATENRNLAQRQRAPLLRHDEDRPRFLLIEARRNDMMSLLPSLSSPHLPAALGWPDEDLPLLRCRHAGVQRQNLELPLVGKVQGLPKEISQSVPIIKPTKENEERRTLGTRVCERTRNGRNWRRKTKKSVSTPLQLTRHEM